MEIKAEHNFLILGLPRSRTAWLANLMNRGDCLCYHELSNRGLSAPQMAHAMSIGAKFVGNSDPGAASVAEELLSLLPSVKVVIIKRPIEGVITSLTELFNVSSEELPFDEFIDNTQEVFERLEPNALVVNYEDLSDSKTIKKIWRYCLGEVSFPEEQYEVLRNLNVQMEPQLIRSAASGGVLPGRMAPLRSKESELLALVLEAHRLSAFRGNISTNTIKSCAIGNGNYENSIAAGLLTTGGFHAPLEQSVEILQEELSHISELISNGVKIPGWGNSFHKGEPDPYWNDVDNWFRLNEPTIYKKICGITNLLHDNNKHLFPNPSTYTAAAAIALKIPKKAAAYLFVQGRLLSWSNIFLKELI